MATLREHLEAARDTPCYCDQHRISIRHVEAALAILDFKPLDEDVRIPLEEDAPCA
jgi:hypothetical protein